VQMPAVMRRPSWWSLHQLIAIDMEAVISIIDTIMILVAVMKVGITVMRA